MNHPVVSVVNEAEPLGGRLSCDASASCRRVVAAVGERLFLGVMERFLAQSADIAVVAATTTGHEALSMVLREAPDVVLLDIDLPGVSGLGVAQKLHAAGMRAPIVLLLNSTREAHHLAAAWAAGVRGFVLKQGTSEDLLHALRVVQGGGSYFDGHLTKEKLAMRGFSGASGTPACTKGASEELAPREREVIHLIALGFTSKEIAQKLGITTKSVETYKARATEKLRLTTRADIVRYGIVQGWFS
jgi:DNA-binding NarL/FixJ family response regulator